VSTTPVLSQPAPSIVWHYTVGAAIKKILADGELHLSTMGKGQDKSLLWFSVNPDWEPSAGKSITIDGKKKPLDKDGTAKLYGGLYRIGVPRSILISWADMKKMYKPESIEALESWKKIGANPLDWWCSPDIVNSKHWSAIEQFDDEWRELRRDEIPESRLPTIPEISAFLKSRNINPVQLSSNPFLLVNRKKT